MNAPSSRLCRVLLLVLVVAVCPDLQAESVGWSWAGAITEKSAVVTARIEATAPVGIRIGNSTTPIKPALTAPMQAGALHRFVVAGLKPDTVYPYSFVGANGAPVDKEPRSFRTFPVPGKPANFRFAVASCAMGMNSPVFAAAAHQGARFFVHTGDFHYFNIAENRVEVFRTAYDVHLSSPRLRTMLAAIPLIYQWDDHDFGPNDSNKNSPSSEASLRNYRELVPHYPLTIAAGATAPVDQAFTVGRVRFILSDLRSQRDPAALRMMGSAQDAWLRAQLLAARDDGSPLIFWVTSVPWNGPATKADRWQGYPAHRAEIANFIKANGLAGKVVILSGDAHMTAIDDGSHSDFATGRGAPIRVFQAGPIANVGSYKGGPYSHGARYKSEPKKKHLNQFGMVNIEDDGKRIHVTWSGRQGADGLGDEVLLSERDAEGPIQFEFTVP
ncbi:MAG: alkaline phosphatase family protein [Rariglobus sp.]|jgi:alkaline phosphatase D|nr:alkaline phosphatase family protein [Rariglobus sp.]